jgi:uncharacterized protein (TIGR02145 family)
LFLCFISLLIINKNVSMKKVLNLLFVVTLFTGLTFLQGCKKKSDPPTVTTTTVSDITVTTATSGGNVTSDGGAEVTARGVCWGTSTGPTITGSKTSDSKGTGSFTSSLTGLAENTNYFVRAYATNSEGTSYGNEVTFTTNQVAAAVVTTATVASITTTTAVSGGNVTSDGGGTITARGVCWAITASPTISGSKTTDGAGTGIFASNLANLTPGVLYHVRAYATNSFGTSYGNELTFTTLSAVPVLTTTAVTGITAVAAVSGGNITSDGGSAVTARGVCWNTTLNPVATDPHTTDGTGVGSFPSNLSGLLPNTAYHVRAYATNTNGTAYGEDMPFTTLTVVPTVTTATVTAITQTTATAGGNVTSNGGATVTARGVCWGTAANPDIAGSHTTDGTGTGTFTSPLTGLTPGILYHVRAYATNSVGIAYGTDVTFTASSVTLAVLTTTVPSGVGITTATSGGNITSAGGGTITEKGVCWSTSATPTLSDAHTTDGTGTGVFASSITGLAQATAYYVRAYATNSAGTAFGNAVQLATLFADADGNTYHFVVIGTQTWMLENLKTTTLNDGTTTIPNVSDGTTWKGLSTMAYCLYDNLPANKDLYGVLYNWYAVNTGNLCPTGWHVASDTDFKTLEMYLGMTQAQADAAYDRGTDQGSKMKSTTEWLPGDDGTNTSGFTGLPGGYRYYLDATFMEKGTSGFWWTSSANDATSAIFRELKSSVPTVYRKDSDNKAGKSVRCIK